jgi:hypothetical protein
VWCSPVEARGCLVAVSLVSVVVVVALLLVVVVVFRWSWVVIEALT